MDPWSSRVCAIFVPGLHYPGICCLKYDFKTICTKIAEGSGCRTNLAFFPGASYVRCLRFGTAAVYGDAPDGRILLYLPGSAKG
ncbi:hypothetical protein KTH81_09630 [Lachnospiraceae bacterium ASD3451]|nr:hypothetical protein [Diplocloster agilis]